MRETLTPLSEVHNQSDRIGMHVPFPAWMRVDAIGINIPRAEELMNLGGIKSLDVVGMPHFDRAVPVSTGVSRDGSLYAGMAGTTNETEHFSSETKGLDVRELLKNVEWTSSTVRLNLEAIQQQIEGKRVDSTKPDSWIPYLDHALRWGIRKAGTEHLLMNFTPAHLETIAVTDILPYVALSYESLRTHGLAIMHPDITYPQLMLLYAAGTCLVGTWIGSHYGGRFDSSGSGYRVSIFPSFEIDRAIALQVLSRTDKLVKPMPSGK